MSRPSRRPPSIRKRITVVFLALLVMAFILLACGFNVVVGKYIDVQAHRQIDIARDNVAREAVNPRRNAAPGSADFQRFMARVSNIARKATFLTQVQALVIDDQRALVYPAMGAEQPESAVYGAIQRSEVDLNNQDIQRVSDEHRTYFLSLMPIEADGGGTDTLVLYMDMTDVTMLARMLNLVLCLIVAVTMLIAAGATFVVSNRITKPVRALSDFAEAIGRGEFAQREIGCKERELIELSETMNRAASQLEKYDSEQKAFFQNVSHELRTPLMSIKGYAEGIQVGVFDDNEGAAGIIIQESDGLTKMVEELLYLGKMDNITSTDERAVLDVRELLSSCGEALRGVAMHEGKAIAYDFADEPVPVMGAEQQLERAFSNLITNGLRHARSKVLLRCHVEDGAALVRVEDDGDGIDEAELERVFDRFYKGKGGKHGIGLSIVRAIVGQHGGWVRAENAQHGATFTVHLPLRESANME